MILLIKNIRSSFILNNSFPIQELNLKQTSMKALLRSLIVSRKLISEIKVVQIEHLILPKDVFQKIRMVRILKGLRVNKKLQFI